MIKLKLLYVISAIYVVACVITLFNEKMPFPFVQYQMFHRLLPNDHVSTYAVSTSKKESVVTDNYTENTYRPYSKREVYEFFNYLDFGKRKALADHMISNASLATGKKKDIFQVVEFKCDCSHYYDLNVNVTFLEYRNEYCKKTNLKF